MQIDLRGRMALVTGGSAGIGRAIAERFAKSGANVVIVARRQNVIDEAVSHLASLAQGQFRGYSCDVSHEAEIDRTYAQIEKDVGAIDILVNNAGASRRKPFLDMARRAITEDFDLKVQAAIRFSQLVIPTMRRQRWGRILNIVTTSAKTPGAGSGPTTFSRAAGMAVTKALSAEFASDNILVNALCIGLVKSDQWIREHREKFSNVPFEDYLKQKAISHEIPLGRLGEADEVANLACFLASDAASYITGAAINIDGGKCPVM